MIAAAGRLRRPGDLGDIGQLTALGRSRREITFETPSPPIETPNSQSAASIVRFWWVITMNWAAPQ